jgi:hypothetical protein
MRLSMACLLVFGLVLAFLPGAAADDDKKGDKEVTLKGKITCPKCDLGIQKTCATVVVVKKDKKELVYYFDKEANKKFHGEICTEAKQGTVTGVLGKEGKQLTIKVSKVTFE